MADTIDVPIGGPDDAAELAKRLSSPEAALVSIGGVVVAAAHRAFEEQRFGDVIWPERYPKMKAPFLNIAPVVQKAGEGRTPTADDFRNRPALGGAGSELAASIAFDVNGDAVEIGSARDDLKPGLFQFGGRGEIPITDTTRATLAKWLGVGNKRAAGSGSAKNYEEREAHKAATGSMRGAPKSDERRRSEYAPKLAFVFEKGRTTYSQGTYARPFIGYTDQMHDDVVGKLAEWLGGTVAT